MRALFGERWIDGLADYHRGSAELRLEVLAARPLERLDGLYPVQNRRDLRKVWNYARAIGVRDTLRKVASRSGERLRNDKYVSCGLARVLEADDGGDLNPGQAVVFLSPLGPACAERLVLPEALLLPLEQLPSLPKHSVMLVDSPLPADEPRWWEALRAWSAESNQPLPAFAAQIALKEAQRLLLDTDWWRARALPRSTSPISTSLPGSPGRARTGAKSAILFGYGNYAKTIILPRIGRNLQVERIHEVDPTQIPLRRRGAAAWDTTPRLSRDERPDAVLIAGYHHTHADLACQALRRGAAVLVEKPISTTRPQLHELLATLRETRGSLFSGYQRRYLPFNDWVRKDLGVGPADPISYHAVVYEVPLPELHWYRWPASRSRLLSNGCHWIDHFLHLNGYPAVSNLDVQVGPDGTLNCSVSAENGAFFTLVLTCRGSRRIGVQDYVELRAGTATARITDACRYEAENRDRIVRRARIGRLAPYRAMYDTIGRHMASGAPGDSALSVQRSAGLVLDLEERCQHLLRNAAQSDDDAPEVAPTASPLRLLKLASAAAVA